MSHELLRRVFIGLFVIIVLSMIAVVLLYVTGGARVGLPKIVPQREVVDNMRDGNFEEAIAAAQKIVNDPNMDPSMKARAQYSTLGAEFRISGDINARLADIRKMKAIILDETVDIRTRVDTLNILAGSYAISGNDTTIYNEIFKDAPFSDYRVENDPELSSRKLSEWSYALRKNSTAALDIAKWYTEQPIRNGVRMTEAQIDDAAAKGEEYLKLAEAASLSEQKDDPEYFNTARYLAYRYWRTLVILRLATQIGEPYQSNYTTEVEKFVEFARISNNYLAQSFVRYIWFFHAAKLNRDGNTDRAKVVLDTLARDISSLEKPTTDSFVRFAYFERKLRPEGASAVQFKTLFALSPEFERAVDAATAQIQ